MRSLFRNNLIRLKRRSVVAAFCTVLGLIGFFNLNGQGVYGWDASFGTENNNDQGAAIVQMPDRGFITTGFSNSFGSSRQIYTIRTDVDGTVLWEHIEGTGANDVGTDLVVASDQNGVVVLGKGENLINGGDDVIFFKLDNDGTKLWTNYFSTSLDDEGRGIAVTNDGGYIITGYTEDGSGSKDAFLLKIDSDGNEEWIETYGGNFDDVGNSVQQLPNGNFVMTGRTEVSNNNSDIYVLKVNSSGVVLFEDSFGSGSGFDEGWDLAVGTDGTTFITGQLGNQSGVAFLRIENDNSFSLETVDDVPLFSIGTGITIADDGNIVISGYHESSVIDLNFLLIKVDPSGNNVFWERSIGQDDFLELGDDRVDIAKTSDGGFVLIGSRTLSGLFDYYLIRTNPNGQLLTNHIVGRAFRDANNDCNFQSSEEGVRNWIVEAKGTDRTFYGSVDAEGNFDVRTDTGTYILNIISPNIYWDKVICQAPDASVTVSVYDTVILNYPIQTAIDCPVMEVDVATARIIPCEDNVYRIDFCNQGTQIAVAAEVEVVLEKNLIFQSSTLPAVQVVDDSLYVFAVGNIDVGDCGFFEMTVNADCNITIANEAHCVRASITPDETCLAPDPNWDESSIRVDSWCEGDSVIFQLNNVGDGNMLQSSKFFIVEDIVMLFGGQPQNTELLPTGSNQRVALPANGKHYRIIVEQPANHPGRNYFATASVEACDPNMTGPSLGFVTQLEEDDRDSYQSKDCIENQLSFDPIDFIGYPKGYLDTCDTNTDLITSQTDLKYHIRFQNVSTDTSNRVVIRDTIPSGLDITSIRPGASSHPYTFEAYGDGFVKFTFSDLEQVDNTINEMLSHGFVKYRISQKPNNPEGTIIENGAIIFQDYDVPNETERVRHQVGGIDITDFVCVSTSVVNPNFPNVEVEVYPNPFNEVATIKITGQQFQDLEFQLFDATGRKVQTAFFENNSLEISRNQLSQGLYIFTINVKGQAVASGKLIVQ